jgi:hypothetical protein
MTDFVQTSNFNKEWLDNIKENIIKLEEYERRFTQGFEDIIEFLTIPSKELSMRLGRAKYYNLICFTTEFDLLLTDLAPILLEDDLKRFKETIRKTKEYLKNKNLFIKELYSSNGKLQTIKPTEILENTQLFLSNLKLELFYKIKKILYIQDLGVMK